MTCGGTRSVVQTAQCSRTDKSEARSPSGRPGASTDSSMESIRPGQTPRRYRAVTPTPAGN
ncbi:hypothetical protein ACQP2K_23880 [Microbispora siamensis]